MKASGGRSHGTASSGRRRRPITARTSSTSAPIPARPDAAAALHEPLAGRDRALLFDACKRADVELVWGQELIRRRRRPAGWCSARRQATEWPATFVVGADGGRSIVRSSAPASNSKGHAPRLVRHRRRHRGRGSPMLPSESTTTSTPLCTAATCCSCPSPEGSAPTCSCGPTTIRAVRRSRRREGLDRAGAAPEVCGPRRMGVHIPLLPSRRVRRSPTNTDGSLSSARPPTSSRRSAPAA